MDKTPAISFHTHLQIGSHHVNHCEDYYFHTELGQNRFLLAVMDGCTMGTDSYFVATLIGKILRKVSREIHFKDFIHKNQAYSISGLLQLVMGKLFEELKQTKSLLQLEREELLSTLLLAVIDTETSEAETLAIGDGLIVCDGNLTEYEQNNRPDYIGYHLHEDFSKWYAQQEQRLSLINVKDLSLVSDGIFSFLAFDNGIYPSISNEEIIQQLLVHPISPNAPNWYKKKMRHFELEYGLSPSDDLAILRICH